MDGTPRDIKSLQRPRRVTQNGQAISTIRDLVGFSQVELAKAAGITQAALSLIENERSCARVPTLRKIASALRVHLTVIMRDPADLDSRKPADGAARPRKKAA